MVVPVRGYLDGIRRLMVGDLYIGRGSKQRGLGRSVWSNPHKVAQSSREEAIRRYSETLRNDRSLSSIIWTLSGARLVCHCTPTQRCHADVLISLFRQTFPAAHDRDQENQPAPTASVLSLLAKLRNEPEEDGGSSADEGVPPKGAGWRGKGQPMMIGSGYVTRELCDGQSPASPGRWPIHDRAYPKNEKWKRASKLIVDFARVHGTAEPLMKLALGQVDKCPFDVDSVSELKRQVVETLQSDGIHMSRTSKDRVDVPIDFRFLSALLTAAQDPEVGLGDFACGVRVGPGVRLGSLLSTRQTASGVSQSSQTHWITWKATQEESLHGDGTTPRYKNCPTKLWTYSRTKRGGARC